MRAVLKERRDDFVLVDTRRIEAIAERLDAGRRSMSMPGIGQLVLLRCWLQLVMVVSYETRETWRRGGGLCRDSTRSVARQKNFARHQQAREPLSAHVDYP